MAVEWPSRKRSGARRRRSWSTVKDDPGFQTGRFDYIDYFSMNARFRARLAAYRIVYEDATARVYVRKAAPPWSRTSASRRSLARG